MNDTDKKLFEELIFKAVQGTKQENSNLISSFDGKISKIITTLENHTEFHKSTTKHLETLNSKVATNIEKIGNLEKHDITQDPKIEAVFKDLTTRDRELKANYKKWVERGVWVVIMIILFIMAKTGLIHPDLLSNVF